MLDATQANVVAQPHGRIPPHNLDAERSLLGGLLLDGAAIDDVLEIVRGPDFYRHSHALVFEAMVDLAQRNEPIDRVQVKDKLVKLGKFEDVGGDEHLDLLDKIVPTAANLAYYAKIIADKARARRLIEASSAIAQLGYEQHGEVGEFAEEAQKRIAEAADARQRGSGPESARAIVKTVFADIEKNYASVSEVTGLSSGNKELDRLTCGFQVGDLIVLAARPSAGKTACGAGWAQYASERLGVGSLIFSMEMLKEALVQRMLSAEGKIDGMRIRSGKLQDHEWAKLAQASGVLSDAPLSIDDTRGLSAIEIRSRARKHARKLASDGKKLGLIVVDYLTLMNLDDTDESVSARVGRNAKRMKELAGELKIPIVLLAQLNRDSARGGKPRKPILTDLRDSGEIEQHADVVIFIHHDDGNSELLVEKQRTGPIASVRVAFTREWTRFDNFDDRPRSPQRDFTEPEGPPHSAEDAA